MKKPTKAQKHGGKRSGRRPKVYKVRNWREYNQALVDRGKVTFWITDKALEQWEEKQRTGKRGKPKLYSDLAIETALTLKEVFHLPLRQVEGFLASILKKMGSVRKVPDYSTLSIRAAFLQVCIRVRAVGAEGIHIVIDSSGAKVYGEGEWKVRQHGWSKHRTWKKLHLGIDEENGDILLGEVTGNGTADCEMFAPLLDQVPQGVRIVQVSADGAFDKQMCYAALKQRGIPHIAIPPQHNAKIWQHGNSKEERLARDENLRRIRAVGRKEWKKEVGYHRRSLAETTMFRLKTIFTDKVRARKEATQRVELLLRVKALNLMTTLGMPDSYVVA